MGVNRHHKHGSPIVTHRSLALTAGVLAAVLVPAAPAAAADPAPCHIDYVTNGDAWSFNGQITITNTGKLTLYGWTLKFVMPTGQILRNGWEATFTIDGQSVTAKSLGYNSEVPPEKTAQVGFHATGDVKGPAPTEFRINDQLCTATTP